MLKDIFEELYTSEDSKFLNLIKEYALKDDKEIFSFILNINNKFKLLQSTCILLYVFFHGIQFLYI